jgi:hypothetical protein
VQPLVRGTDMLLGDGMKTWQKVSIGVVVALALLGGVIAAVFWATSGPVKAADAFFAATGRGDFAAAHAQASKGLKASTDPAALERFLRDGGVGPITETSWSSRSISGDVARLEGTLTTASGQTLPVTVELVKEGDVWRVNFIEGANSGVSQRDAAEPSGPDNDLQPLDPALSRTALAMTRVANMQLVESLRTRDFEFFAESWIDEVSAQELSDNLNADLPAAALRAFENARPEIVRSGNDEAGRLVVEAVFRTSDHIMETRYVYRPDPDDPDGWAISGLDMNIRPAGQGR